MFAVVSYPRAPFSVAVSPAPIGTRKAFATVEAAKFSVIAAVPVLTPLFRTTTPGKRAADRVLLVIFAAFVVSVVAEAAKATPPVFVTVRTPVLDTSVPSPPTVNPPRTPPLFHWICPLVPPGVAPFNGVQVHDPVLLVV
jgi:hypothetical protein